MQVTLTEEQMLTLWRKIHAVEPQRLDCTIERYDGPDLDGYLRQNMRQWYLELLDEGPELQNCPVNLAKHASITVRGDGVHIITAPEECRRILYVDYTEWHTLMRPDGYPQDLQCSVNPFWTRPQVVRINRRQVGAIAPKGTLCSLICTVDSDPTLYTFDESALRPFLPNLCLTK